MTNSSKGLRHQAGRLSLAFILGLGALAASGSASSTEARPRYGARPHHASHPRQHVARPPARSVRSREGVASVYHQRFHGRQMADGGRFSVSSDSAASRTLPLGTVARVTNVSNGRSMTVRIRDRGPYVGARIIDLSPRSARGLGMTGKPGLMRVVVSPISLPRRG